LIGTGRCGRLGSAPSGIVLLWREIIVGHRSCRLESLRGTEQRLHSGARLPLVTRVPQWLPSLVARLARPAPDWRPRGPSAGHHGRWRRGWRSSWAAPCGGSAAGTPSSVCVLPVPLCRAAVRPLTWAARHSCSGQRSDQVMARTALRNRLTPLRSPSRPRGSGPFLYGRGAMTQGPSPHMWGNRPAATRPAMTDASLTNQPPATARQWRQQRRSCRPDTDARSQDC